MTTDTRNLAALLSFRCDPIYFLGLSLYYKPRNILKLFMIFRYNSFTYRLTEPCLCGYMAAMQQAQLSSVAHTLILWISNCRAVVQRDDIQLNCHFACVRKGCLFAHRALVAAKPR